MQAKQLEDGFYSEELHAAEVRLLITLESPEVTTQTPIPMQFHDHNSVIITPTDYFLHIWSKHDGLTKLI